MVTAQDAVYFPEVVITDLDIRGQLIWAHPTRDRAVVVNEERGLIRTRRSAVDLVMTYQDFVDAFTEDPVEDEGWDRAS